MTLRHEEVVRAGVEAGDARGHGRLRGEHEDRVTHALRADALAPIEAAPIGQAEIEHDHIRPFFGEVSVRVGNAPHACDPVAITQVNERVHELGDVFVVFHDQYAPHRCGTLSCPHRRLNERNCRRFESSVGLACESHVEQDADAACDDAAEAQRSHHDADDEAREELARELLFRLVREEKLTIHAHRLEHHELTARHRMR